MYRTELTYADSYLVNLVDGNKTFTKNESYELDEVIIKNSVKEILQKIAQDFCGDPNDFSCFHLCGSVGKDGKKALKFSFHSIKNDNGESFSPKQFEAMKDELIEFSHDRFYFIIQKFEPADISEEEYKDLL